MTRAISLLITTVVALVCAPSAMAHPLGNFTTNQLAQVTIDEDEARIDYVLDLAEIPTFRLVQRHDQDGDGAIAASEHAAFERELLGGVRGGLRLQADGGQVPLEVGATALRFPEGQAGLDLSRLEVSLVGEVPAEPATLELANSAFEGTSGWKAIQIRPGTGTDVTSSVPSSDPTNGLRSYPADLLDSPPDTRSATFDVKPGTGRVSAPDGVTGGPATDDRAQDGFANLLAGGDTAGWAILLLLGAAFGWGALHALSPGHGKAMVAGYLVGARGTPRHAAILGATVTITHTAAVFALGLVTLAASEYILPEQVYPWLAVASGLAVVVIGFAVMRSRLRRWRAMRADAAGAHGPTAGEGHAYAHSHGHAHHHHHPAADEPITMRSLIALGVSGGLIPCPSALVVLVAAISQHRLGLGMLLIFAFSLGLAATLTAVGLAVIWGGRILERVRPERRLFGGRFAGAIPAISATVIVLAGVLITVRAIPSLG